MNLSSNWSFPTSVRIGKERLKEIGDCCQISNISKPLIVTDQNLKDHKITHRLISEIGINNLSYSLFHEVDPNPNEKNLTDGITKLKSEKFDGIIAFGGGSALDLGKLIAFMAHQSLPVWEFEDLTDNWKKANPDKILPIIAIPTTAGTGSEVGRAAVLTDTEHKIKKIIFHPKMLPESVICDPTLTLDLPKTITAGTGMDALAHCLEAYCSPGYHPMADGIALVGMKLVKENLLEAYTNGTNVNARTNMLSAALMGATAFQKGLGAMHSLSHPVGAIYNTHHGTTNAAVMEKVLKFNKEIIQKKIDHLAIYLELERGFDGFIDFINQLCRDLNIPQSLKEMGVREDKLHLLSQMAIKDPTASGNPKKMTLDNTLKLLKSCY